MTCNLYILPVLIFFLANTSFAENIYRVSGVSADGSLFVEDGNHKSILNLAGVRLPDSTIAAGVGDSLSTAAKQYIENLLLGERIYVRFTPEDNLGIPGTNPALIYRVPDNLFINRDIILRGYGYVPAGYPAEYIESFRRYQEQARASRCGFWSLETFQPYQPFLRPPVEPVVQYRFNFTVWIDKAAKVYHRAGCEDIADDMPPMKVIAAQEEGYQSCRKCGNTK